MPDSTGDLRSRIAELEAENARLRATLDGETQTASTTAVAALHDRRRWRAASAAVLIVIGVVLAPLSVVARWAQDEVTDTDRFVATVGPLISNSSVRADVTDAVVGAIDQQINSQQLVGEVMDFLSEQAADNPRIQQGLQLLTGPAANGLDSLIRSTTEKVIDSPAFATAWNQALRTAHQQANEALSGDPNAIVTIDSSGTVGISLGPLVDQVKNRLADQGLSLASRIPTIDKTIPVVQSDQIIKAQNAYRMLNVVGSWLIWVSLALIAAGVLLARRRLTTLSRTGLLLALAMACLALALMIGRAIVVPLLSPQPFSADSATIIYNALVGYIQDMLRSVFALGVVVAIVAWFVGRSAPATAARGASLTGIGAVRDALAARGFSTGAIGRFCYRYRRPIRVVIAAVGAVLVLFVRPMPASSIVWIAVGAALLCLVLQAVMRPPEALEPPSSGPRTAELPTHS